MYYRSKASRFYYPRTGNRAVLPVVESEDEISSIDGEVELEPSDSLNDCDSNDNTDTEIDEPTNICIDCSSSMYRQIIIRDLLWRGYLIVTTMGGVI